MKTPQLHSHDYYVRASSVAMGSIVFQHLATTQDEGVLDDLPAGSHLRAGMTEWQGMLHGRVVSIGWDWACRGDGRIDLVRVVAPRTNLRVVDAKGYDVTLPETADLFWNLIETLPWRAEVRIAMAADGCLPLH